MGKVMYCEKCGRVYFPFLSKKCDFCKTKMKILSEDMKYKYHIHIGEDWLKISDEERIQRKENFVMGELQSNPLFSIEEYNKQVQKQIELNQELAKWHKKKQLEQQSKNIEHMKKETDKINCIPKCPICNSTNINKITVTKRAVKTAAFGIFGAVDDAGKTYKCGNCGSKF